MAAKPAANAGQRGADGTVIGGSCAGAGRGETVILRSGRVAGQARAAARTGEASKGAGRSRFETNGGDDPMPSNSLIRLNGERADALDEIENAHAMVGGIERGRRHATQQINYSYT